MRDYREQMGRSLKELRRETRWQALYISLPVTAVALLNLLIAAGFYVKPLVLLGLVEPSVWGPMQVSPAVEHSLTAGLPLAVGACGVYFLAMKVLWRIKVGEPSARRNRSFSA